MNALIKTLYKSDLFEITDFVCQCTACGFSGVEYQRNFSICYIQRGSFIFKVFSDDLECFNSRFLLNRPGFTHRVKHYHTLPDKCLIIGFSAGFFASMQDVYRSGLNGFLTKKDVHSIVLGSTAETEYIMYRLKSALASKNPDHLEIDGIILDLTEKIFHMENPVSGTFIADKKKQTYLPAVEKSKEYIHEKFAGPISIEQLAGVSHMSTFHFNRVFKQITRLSPYQYLLKFRIHHASHLLKTTEESITNVGWVAGFNSPDHFSFAFKDVTGLSPQQYRGKNKQEF
jgi:AraC family transcriptional regulator